MYKTDYHIHTVYSDGKNQPEEYVNQALHLGLSEVGFSDHVLVCREDEKWCMEPSEVDSYYSHCNSLREKVTSIPVKVGLEIDYIEGREEDIADMLSKYDLDYRIGSVHFMKGRFNIDSTPEIYEGQDFDSLFKIYFQTITKAVTSGLFDIIGHFDLIRIFCHKPSFDPTPLYKEFSRCLKECDVAFEINTNGRNKPLHDFYPDRNFLKLLAHDKNIVCVNSDAHYPLRMAQYFDEAYALLRAAGFTEMATFSHRQRKMVKM